MDLGEPAGQNSEILATCLFWPTFSIWTGSQAKFSLEPPEIQDGRHIWNIFQYSAIKSLFIDQKSCVIAQNDRIVVG